MKLTCPAGPSQLALDSALETHSLTDGGCVPLSMQSKNHDLLTKPSRNFLPMMQQDSSIGKHLQVHQKRTCPMDWIITNFCTPYTRNHLAMEPGINSACVQISWTMFLRTFLHALF